MGLDDLVPDDAEVSSGSNSSTSNKSKNPFQRDDLVSIGSEPHDKHIPEDEWPEVKRVIREEFGMKVGTVKNMPAKKRYETLHEAITFNPDSEQDEESSLRSKNRCLVCDRAADNVGVVIADNHFCVQHTAGQVRNALDELEDEEDSR